MQQSVPLGMTQALAIWIVAAAGLLLVPNPVAAGAFLGGALLACLILGAWHRRSGRADTSVGAYAGLILWPVALGLTLLLINVASTSTSSFE
ncbi:hypothetical protein [Actinoplanes rectilineatus]|uniref:hypothetical protein n=1 Tax=Actinoplanes rectilineatus TaxID=113571 RepID=UPI001470024B|nr:hypothetical protein [Actinoplanes rectilineatus]